MKTVYNRLLPPKGFKAINLFGVVMVRKGYRMTDTDLNHDTDARAAVCAVLPALCVGMAVAAAEIQETARGLPAYKF